MTIPYADLDVRSGNTFHYEFSFTQQDDTALDLTGSKLVLKATSGAFSKRYATDDVSPLLTITDATGGKAVIKVGPAETATWLVGSIPYELERWIGTDQYTLVEGRLVVTLGVNDNVDP